MLKKIIFILVIAVLIVWFSLQNAQTVSIKLFLWEVNTIPLAIIIIGCILAGALLSAISSVAANMRIKKRLRFVEREHARLKTVVDEMIENKGDIPFQVIRHPEGSSIEESDKPSFFDDSSDDAS